MGVSVAGELVGVSVAGESVIGEIVVGEDVGTATNILKTWVPLKGAQYTLDPTAAHFVIYDAS